MFSLFCFLSPSNCIWLQDEESYYSDEEEDESAEYSESYSSDELQNDPLVDLLYDSYLGLQEDVDDEEEVDKVENSLITGLAMGMMDLVRFFLFLVSFFVLSFFLSLFLSFLSCSLGCFGLTDRFSSSRVVTKGACLKISMAWKNLKKSIAAKSQRPQGSEKSMVMMLPLLKTANKSKKSKKVKRKGNLLPLPLLPLPRPLPLPLPLLSQNKMTQWKASQY